MDFLDVPKFATNEKAIYAGFLGIDKLFPKSKASSGQSGYKSYLEQNFPFSDNCGDQQELVYNLRLEQNDFWEQKRQTKNQEQIALLEQQSVILADYLDKAIKYMDTVSCPVAPTVITHETIEPAFINTKPVVIAAPVNNQVIKGVDNKILGFAVAGIVVLAIFKIIKF